MGLWAGGATAGLGNMGSGSVKSPWAEWADVRPHPEHFEETIAEGL